MSRKKWPPSSFERQPDEPHRTGGDRISERLEHQLQSLAPITGRRKRRPSRFIGLRVSSALGPMAPEFWISTSEPLALASGFAHQRTNAMPEASDFGSQFWGHWPSGRRDASFVEQHCPRSTKTARLPVWKTGLFGLGYFKTSATLSSLSDLLATPAASVPAR
jgi:hypothetical protein